MPPSSMARPVAFRADGSLARPEAVEHYGVSGVYWIYSHKATVQHGFASYSGDGYCHVTDDDLTAWVRFGLALALAGWAAMWPVRLGRALAVAGALAASDGEAVSRG